MTASMKGIATVACIALGAPIVAAFLFFAREPKAPVAEPKAEVSNSFPSGSPPPPIPAGALADVGDDGRGQGRPAIDPSERLRAVILAEETPETRGEIERLLAGLNLDQVERIVDIFNRLPRDGRQHEYAFTRLMEAWAALDGAGALAFGLAATSDSGVREEFYFAAGPALQIWASHDLDGASRAVAELATDLGPMDRDRFAIYLMEARQDRGGAMAWIDSVATTGNASAFAARCMLALSRTLVASGDAEGARALLQSEATRDFSGEAIAWMATHTALEDPGAAWTWLANLPDKAVARRGVREMMIEWGGMDETATRFWSDGFSEGRGFDGMVEEYVATIRRTSPPAALQWSSLLEDRARRHSLFAQIMRAWEENDPDAAGRWAESYGH